jgi:hypothetical protein
VAGGRHFFDQTATAADGTGAHDSFKSVAHGGWRRAGEEWGALCGKGCRLRGI